MRYKVKAGRTIWLVAALTTAIISSAHSAPKTDWQRLSENMQAGRCAEVRRIINLSTSIRFVQVMSEAIRLNSLCGWDEAVRFEPGPFDRVQINQFVWAMTSTSATKNYTDWAERLFKVAADPDALADTIATSSGSSQPHDLCGGSLEMLEVLRDRGVDIEGVPRFWLKRNCQTDIWGADTRVVSGFSLDCYNSPSPNNHLVVPLSVESNGVHWQAISDPVQFNVRIPAAPGTVFVDNGNNGVCTIKRPSADYRVMKSGDRRTSGGTHPQQLSVAVLGNITPHGDWQFIIKPAGDIRSMGYTTLTFFLLLRRT